VTVLVPISILGTSILVVAIRLLMQSGNRRERSSVTVEEYANARQALDSVFIETAIVRRIFSVEDANFIEVSATPIVRRSFLKERKQLALRWFRKTRKQVAQLMDLHLRLASYTYDPNPRFELRLTVTYLAFVAVFNVVLLLLWLLGPFKASRGISYAIRMAGSFCSAFSIRLGRVNPTRLSPVANLWYTNGPLY
jgi:hypothetical protein